DRAGLGVEGPVGEVRVEVAWEDLVAAEHRVDPGDVVALGRQRGLEAPALAGREALGPERLPVPRAARLLGDGAEREEADVVTLGCGRRQRRGGGPGEQPGADSPRDTGDPQPQELP